MTAGHAFASRGGTCTCGHVMPAQHRLALTAAADSAENESVLSECGKCAFTGRAMAASRLAFRRQSCVINLQTTSRGQNACSTGFFT